MAVSKPKTTATAVEKRDPPPLPGARFRIVGEPDLEQMESVVIEASRQSAPLVQRAASVRDDLVVKIKALESFEKAADGQATKIIVPSEIQSLAGLAASFKGLLEDEKK